MVTSGTTRARQKAFTLVEVMMAATIVLVGFIGLIEAVTITSGMMDHARRQTLANQILNNAIEDLRTASWTTVNALPTASTSIAIDPQLWPAWKSTTRYSANSVVSYNGNWYRCTVAHSNQLPTNTSYWTATVSGSTSDVVTYNGATYTLSRSLNSTNPVTNIREVTFTVTWVVTTSRTTSGGSLLTFTFTRSISAWFGKYGLNLSYQRS